MCHLFKIITTRLNNVVIDFGLGDKFNLLIHSNIVVFSQKVGRLKHYLQRRERITVCSLIFIRFNSVKLNPKKSSKQNFYYQVSWAINIICVNLVRVEMWSEWRWYNVNAYWICLGWFFVNWILIWCKEPEVISAGRYFSRKNF